MSIGQKFEGESYLKITMLGPTNYAMASGYDKIEHLMDFRMAIKGDILKIQSLSKSLKADQICRIGSILSNGQFLLSEFKLSELVSLYKRKKQHNPKVSSSKYINIKFKNVLTYTKEDEIFSCFEFSRHNRVLLGTQKGTILLAKISKDREKVKLKIINSYNRFYNFMITNISIMPDHSKYFEEQDTDSDNEQGTYHSSVAKNHFVFAYSTADGYIKI